MNKLLFIKSAVLTLFVAFFVAITVLAMRPDYVGTRAGKADENYIESENCTACHKTQFESWQATYHSKMTQDASDTAVVGDFVNDNVYEYLGVKTTMTRRGDDYFMTFAHPSGRVETNKIERTVGSRRIQQYVTKQNSNYVRLPIAWDIENKRWMSLNGSFFYADGENFNQHTAKWDLNCVFCHNVKAQPNFNFQTATAKTEVAELGIACGACHGAAAEHAETAGSPANRLNWHLDESADRKIVQPRKLAETDSDRAMMICGHCHGQRVPEPESRIREILQKGDPFDAGEDLGATYKAVHADTTIGKMSFESRFWADGSPRLTAYEYQGITGSECFTNGEKGNRINCMTCHTMHEGDPKGQLKPEMRTNQACTQCHTELNEAPALQQHTKHSANSEAASCYSCHMPQVVYGIMTFHPTHDISVPRPELTAEKGVPNACNQCHVDQSVNWAIDATKNLWADSKRFADSQKSQDAQFDQPEAARMLFAGDALTRALAANTLAKRGDAESSAPLLAEAFARENYPIVRFFAAQGLVATHWNLAKPDYLATNENRQTQISSWFERIESGKREEVRRLAEQLRRLRKDIDLEVGE